MALIRGRVYLDHAATSPTLAEVARATRRWAGVPANPSSAHAFGRRAAEAVEAARAQVAAAVGGVADGVVFTSGATEANHLGVRGAAERVVGPVWISAVEHPSVHAAAASLRGRDVRALPVDVEGRVIPSMSGPGVVAVLAVQHETGVIQPLDAVRAWRASHPDAWVHVDATQALGRAPLDLGWADSVALSAHKIGGPPGVGALVLRDGGAFPPLFAGAQERGRRGGTVNVAGAVGFGVACELASPPADAAVQRALEAGLVRLGAAIVGRGAPRVVTTTLAVFQGLRGDAVVQALDLRGVCCSAGAACASGSLEPSPTLRAMGHPEPWGGVRFSLGPATTRAHVARALDALAEALVGLRAERDLVAWLASDDGPT